MNTVIFVNATIGFSENLFLVVECILFLGNYVLDFQGCKTSK